MKYGIIEIAATSQRIDATHQSEMVNQLLFGDIVEILETKNEWLLVRNLFDDYEGWIHKHGVAVFNQSSMDLINTKSKYINSTLLKVQHTNKLSSQYILPGSTLIQYNAKELSFQLLDVKYKILESNFIEFKGFDEILKYFLNTPYLWGGRSLFGIDCSGFSQIAYKIFGTWIPRDASQQAQIGKSISFINDAKLGDLAFFDNEEAQITHVGILLNNKEIIHASGYVKIDSIDHQGIFNKETNSYSHKLRLIKRIIN